MAIITEFALCPRCFLGTVVVSDQLCFHVLIPRPSAQRHLLGLVRKGSPALTRLSAAWFNKLPR